jgi:hypothetical protein
MSITEILQFATQYSVYSGCILFISGLIGNILNILVFTQLKQFRDNRWAFYLTVDSISNFLYQFVYISLTILTTIYGDDGTAHSLFWCRLRYMLPVALALTTFYTICLASIDQFCSTNYRFNLLQQLCTLKLAHGLTFVCICFWIAHSIVFGLFFYIQPPFGCVIVNSTFLRYATYFYYPVLNGLLPITIASFFGILAYRNVRHIIRRQIPIARRRLDQQMTAMILMRVISFVCLVLPFTIYRIFIVNYPISQHELMKYAIAQLVEVILIFWISLNFTVKMFSSFE